MDFLSNSFLDNSIQAWLVSLGVALGVFLLLTLIRRLTQGRLARLVQKSSTNLDDFLIPVVDRTRWFILLGLGLYIGSTLLILPAEVQVWIDRLFRLLLALQVGLWGSGIIALYVTKAMEAKIENDQGEDATTLDALGLIGNIALWLILALIVLDNLGVEINSLVTSLGIGGIAVALAVQNILGDLFASMSITLDKPFAIGDFIVVGEFEGNVEDIGLKSTRVRSLSGEEVIFSNNDLLGSRIRNYKRLEKRRISFSVGVVYGTPVDKLRRIPDLIREAIEPHSEVEFERAHLKTMGDYSLEYAVVYHVLVPEFSVYMDVHEKINLDIYQRFLDQGIEFAFPTQTLVIEQEPGA